MYDLAQHSPPFVVAAAGNQVSCSRKSAATDITKYKRVISVTQPAAPVAQTSKLTVKETVGFIRLPASRLCK